MNEDSKIDLNSLRELLGLPEPVESEPTPFAEHVTAVLSQAVIGLRDQGVIEVEDAKLEALTREFVDTALEATALKRLPLRLVKTLIHSEHIEEVYGTDEEISAALRPFLEAI